MSVREAVPFLVEITLLFRGHEGCWRPGLEFIINRYKEFFYPVNDQVWQHHKAFAITNPFTLTESVDALPIAWSEIHNHFPYYSNYAPTEAAWDSVVLHDYPELAAEILPYLLEDFDKEFLKKMIEN